MVFILLGQRIEQRFKAVQDQFGDISAKAQESFSGIRVAKAYVQEQQEIGAFARLNRDYATPLDQVCPHDKPAVAGYGCAGWSGYRPLAVDRRG